jgi:outer membrane protein assembly factor BamB
MNTWRYLGAIVVLSSPLLAVAADDYWPGFRGPTGQGISTETGLPLKWSKTENVAWKTPIPGEGWSSPIVWGDRIFVTTATDKGAGCHVLALDRSSGKVLWDREVFQQKIGPKRPKNSDATPTPVTDGERVYAVFGDGSIVALTVEGKDVWTFRDVAFISDHGLGASPVLYKDLVIMPYDGSDPNDPAKPGWKKPWDQAVLVALDKATGKVRWKGNRGLSRLGHVTPIVVQSEGKDLLLSNAGDVIQGFDPATGERLWTVAAQGEGVVPSPVFAEGLALSWSGFEAPTMRAVKPGGKGDVTKTHLAWESKQELRMISSCVYVKPYLYAVTENGLVWCLEAATGKTVWQERLGGGYSASPVYADGKLYFLSEQGDTVVLEPGPKYQERARNPLDEVCQASMAVAPRQLFIRTANHLFCIRERRP